MVRLHVGGSVRVVDGRVRDVGKSILRRRRCRMRVLHGDQVGAGPPDHVL